MPPIFQCTRRLHFCAGHRVMGHENKCAHPHGHNYIVFITAQASLDKLGRVIDFSVLKDRIDPWIQVNWDHGFIFHEDDAQMESALQAFERPGGAKAKIYRLPCNPTAENLAHYLLEVVCPENLPRHIIVTKVRVWETPNCYADAVLNPKDTPQ